MAAFPKRWQVLHLRQAGPAAAGREETGSAGREAEQAWR